MGDDTMVTVWVRQLRSVDGTAVENVDDIKEEFKRGTDIHDLKRELFPNYDHRMLSKIQFYTPPPAGSVNWEKKDPRTELETKTYGYFPVADEQQHEQQPRTQIAQQQQQPQPQAGLLELLENVKGSELSESELNHSLIIFPKGIDKILESLNERQRKWLARNLWLRLSTLIKTQTRLAVIDQYLFDGPVPGAFGKVGTEVQFVVKGSALYCAKTMRNAVQLQGEFYVATRIHKNHFCPTVMPVLELLELSEGRFSMVTPYYPLALSTLANGHLHKEGCINVALCGLATIKAFQSENLCHGDIKPANMMLTAGGQLVVTIDFGSTVEYEQSLTSVTPKLGLDCVLEGSLKYDLTCLASSLYSLCTGQNLPDTSEALLESIETNNSMHSTALTIAKFCLEGSDIDSIWEDAKHFVEALDTETVNRSLIVSFNSVWPARRET